MNNQNSPDIRDFKIYNPEIHEYESLSTLLPQMTDDWIDNNICGATVSGMRDALKQVVSKTRTITCDATIYIHGHYETKEPVQIDVLEWNGRRDLLEIFESEDTKDLMECLENLETEKAQYVKVEFDYDNRDFGIELYVSNITKS